MNREDIKESLRAEIAQLQQILELLEQIPGGTAIAPPTRGQFKAEPTATRVARSASKKRRMSLEGKARIAAAQRKRWAASKKADAALKKRVAAKKSESTRTTKKATTRWKKSNGTPAKKTVKLGSKRATRSATGSTVAA